MQEQLRKWAAECTPTFWSENEKESDREALEESTGGGTQGSGPRKWFMTPVLPLSCFANQQSKELNQHKQLPRSQPGPWVGHIWDRSGYTTKDIKTKLTVEPTLTKAGPKMRPTPNQADCMLNKNTNILHRI